MKIEDAAKVFIENKKTGRYLFSLRDDKPTISNPNTYGLLGGGIAGNEKPIDALMRELREESNIVIFDIKELGNKIVSNIIRNSDNECAVKNKLFVFRAETDAVLDEIELYEGQHLKYFTIDEALDLENLSSPIRECIGEFREEL